MELNFNIDFDSGEVHIVVDNGTTLSAYKADNMVKFKNFHKLDDEAASDVIKDICYRLLRLVD